MTSDRSSIVRRVLIIDDDDATLAIFQRVLPEMLGADVVTSRFPTSALQLASKECFDLILVDVTINYNGSSFGGFDVCNILNVRFGDSTVIAYSQYITDDLLKQYNYHFQFMEKGHDMIAFLERFTKSAITFRKRQKIFVAMPFGNSYDSLYAAIETAVIESNYKSIRIDRRLFNSSVVDKIHNEIKACKAFLFVTESTNPNVFYECGFAAALNKEIITITADYKDLPFDVRDRNAIAYGCDLGILRRELVHRLSFLSAP